jgi:anti-anti-sigma factor
MVAVFVPAPQLDIQTRAEDEHWLVEVRGGIDLSNVDALEAELRRLSNGAIVLDLSQVDFIDCTGVALLIRTAGRLTVGAVSSAVERVLRLCDIDMDLRHSP